MASQIKMARDVQTLSEETLDTKQDTSMIDSRAKSLSSTESAAQVCAIKCQIEGNIWVEVIFNYVTSSPNLPDLFQSSPGSSIQT